MCWVERSWEPILADRLCLEGKPGASSLLSQQPPALISVSWEQGPPLVPTYEQSLGKLARPADKLDSSPVQLAPGGCEGLSVHLEGPC